MGLSLRKLFKAREKPGEDVQRVSSVEIADQQVRDVVTNMSERAGVLDLRREDCKRSDKM